MNRELLIASLKEIERLVGACLEAASEANSPERAATAPIARPTSRGRGSAQEPDFSAPVRFFMKKHATGMNGQQKFTLLIAYLTSGKPDGEATLEAIRDTWSGMKGLLGKFNTGYAVWAKDNGWVDSPKPRVYVLLPGWKEILRHDA